MAYTPTVWQAGDVITAEKLNKAEQGIAGAYLRSIDARELTATDFDVYIGDPYASPAFLVPDIDVMDKGAILIDDVDDVPNYAIQYMKYVSDLNAEDITTGTKFVPNGEDYYIDINGKLYVSADMVFGEGTKDK